MVFDIVYVAVALVCVEYVQGGVRFVPKEKYNQTLQVKTTQGIIQGKEVVTINGATMFSYQSIPFAEPPLNDLRFKEPKPLKPWKGVLDATQESTGCIETHLRLTGLSTLGEEDCLYLDVSTPKIPQLSTEPLPVMIWIYGGGFIEGNSSSMVYGPDYFAEYGVILVKFNYRLGIFGFLTTEDTASPGNYGLKDQLAVLRWTKENIIFFGGDPKRITIFGESAGACSVMHHMLSKKSRGLFSGAIAMSGVATAPWCNKKTPRNVAFDIASAIGIKDGNTTIFMEKLRSLSTARLRELQSMTTLTHGVRIYHEGLPFTPSIEPIHDGAFLTEPAYNLLARGDVAKVPLLIGRNSQEFKQFVIGFPYLRVVGLLFEMSPRSMTSPFNLEENVQTQIAKLIVKKYFRSNSITAGTDSEIIQYLNDIFFNIPIDNTIELLYKHIPVYSYVYNYESKIAKPALEMYTGLSFSQDLPGSGHAEEVPLFFKFLMVTMTDAMDKTMSHRVMTLWTNFAKYRNATPKPDKLLNDVVWPRVESSKKVPYLEIGKEMKIKIGYRKSYVQFWRKLISKYNRQYYL